MKRLDLTIGINLLFAIWACHSAGTRNVEAKADTVRKDTQSRVKTAEPRPAQKEAFQSVGGDFNGDGRREKMWLEKPELAGVDQGNDECTGGCTCYIRFSDPGIKAIAVEDCIGGDPVNEGDLNGDGADDIGLLPDWFQSCWRDYRVWSWDGRTWYPTVKPFATHCNQWDQRADAISADKNRPGMALIHYSDVEDVAKGNEILMHKKWVPVLRK